jgi:polysaccharide deacetylase family protein (PEP-CTERM system associated)
MSGRSLATFRHGLSFDVEEHFQVSAFDSPMRRRHWEAFESRVERNVERILCLLDKRNVKATFFVLGWVAERQPNLVKRIGHEGHEIGSHGYAHELITAQTPDLFREDVRRAKAVLEDIIGAPVLGYRAPTFTITAETRWALPILVEEGYRYDSSIFPIVHDRYGMPGAIATCHQIATSAGPLWEIPLSTAKIAGCRIPIAGGGYFRLFPYRMLRCLLRRVERTGQPLVIYLHPWELDPAQPRMNGPLFSRFRHYLNLGKTERRLSSMLEDFSFGPLCDLLGDIQSASGLSPCDDPCGIPGTRPATEIGACGFPSAVTTSRGKRTDIWR